MFKLQILLAEGRFISDLELTEKEIERMVMEASRAEYLANKQQPGHRESSTSGAEPSSSGASKCELPFSHLLYETLVGCHGCHCQNHSNECRVIRKWRP